MELHVKELDLLTQGRFQLYRIKGSKIMFYSIEVAIKYLSCLQYDINTSVNVVLLNKTYCVSKNYAIITVKEV